MITPILIIVAIVVAIAIVTFTRWYVKAPTNMAFVRTGLGGKKVVVDSGVIVLPIVQNIQWISLETFKLEVFKADKEAFITKDKMRVDIGAEFYVKIEAVEDHIEKASRSLGDKSFSAEGIKSLVEEKLVSALRSTAASMTLIELHENRRGFAKLVMETLRDALVPNGLTLEDVSIFHLDQTEKGQLDPNNIFDAEGLKQITAQTSDRQRERNEIERNTEVAIRKKDVEAVKLKLELDKDREFAEAEQRRQIETYRAQKRAETEQFAYQQEQKIREAEILKERVIEELQIERERAIKEAQLKREISLLEQVRTREQAEIEKERIIEETRRNKEIAIILKEKEKIEEEKSQLTLLTAKEEAAQKVIDAVEKAKVERAKMLALIEAMRELEVTQKKAEAIERMALSKIKDGEAEAYAKSKIREAENLLDPKFIYRDVLQNLIDKAPQILGELMAPARQIESIKVLDIHGWSRSDAGENGSSPAGKVLSTFLNVGAALPLLKELLEFSKIDTGKAAKGLLDQLPGIKELLSQSIPKQPEQ